ncbi:MAG TPA: hypothetical protein VHL58_14235 [Thermoanaerobaculia bacterium]|nr:hypothetical protein [Thermoanaerobaculia bacterium]
MKIPIFGTVIDERFLMHRLRSTSIGGLAGCLAAVGIFEWRLFRDHVWRWDLLSVAITMVVVKIGVLIWYRLTD